jgi:hypothetical protein
MDRSLDFIERGYAAGKPRNAATCRVFVRSLAYNYNPGL